MLKLFTILIFFDQSSSIVINNKILLRDVQSLSFRNGFLTTARRGKPIPHLNCESGYCAESPKNVMCKNVGLSDNSDPIWECTGYGMSGYKMTHSDVSCEGYDNPTDQYILKGSCGVFFGISKDKVYDDETTTTTTTTTTTDYYTTYTPHYGNYGIVVLPIILILMILIICVSNVPPPQPIWYNPCSWNWHSDYVPSHRPYYVPTPFTRANRTTTTTTTTTRNNNANRDTYSTTSGTTRNNNATCNTSSTTSGTTRRR
jgi:hypothetical protein